MKLNYWTYALKSANKQKRGKIVKEDKKYLLCVLVDCISPYKQIKLGISDQHGLKC